MKPNRPRFRKPAVITNPRWLPYATAAMASTVACASSAEAKIHYSGLVNHDFANGGFAGLLGPGVTLDLSAATGSQVGNSNGKFGNIHIRTAAHFVGTFVGTLASYAGVYLSELPKGQTVSAQPFAISCRWSSSCGCQVCYHVAYIGGDGRFRNPGIGFIGFVFVNGGGEAQYGWARVKTTGPPNYGFILVDYAWGDYGDHLSTGEIGTSSTPLRPNEQVDATPKEGSLGLLALGAAGLLTWRKRRSQVAR